MQTKHEVNGVEPTVDRPTVRPAVDIFENQDELLLVVDLPGVHADALSVDLDKDTLTIVGRRDLKMPSDARRLAGPSDGWDYRRQFVVPELIDASKIRAEFKRGVLEVRLPRQERAKPRRIAIATA